MFVIVRTIQLTIMFTTSFLHPFQHIPLTYLPTIVPLHHSQHAFLPSFHLTLSIFKMITNNPYLLFTTLTLDSSVVHNNEFVLLPHQCIPKYYIVSEPDVHKIILHYSLGSGKTATAVFVLLHYLKLYRMYDFMSHYTTLNVSFMKKHKIHKNVIVIGAWQTQSQMEVEIMRPEFNIINEEFTNEMKRLLNSTIPEQRTKGEELRKRIIRDIDRDIRFCGYQSFFNTVFPSIKSESYGQNVETLLTEYFNHQIEVSEQFLSQYHDSLIVIDEMQRLYSIDGINSFGVAIMAVSTLAKKYNIKMVFLTGTMINSTVKEIVDIMNIMGDGEHYEYSDYIVQEMAEGNLTITHINPNKKEEIIEFFRRKFMFYDQTNNEMTKHKTIIGNKEMVERNKQATALTRTKVLTGGGIGDIYGIDDSANDDGNSDMNDDVHNDANNDMNKHVDDNTMNDSINNTNNTVNTNSSTTDTLTKIYQNPYSTDDDDTDNDDSDNESISADYEDILNTIKSISNEQYPSNVDLSSVPVEATPSSPPTVSDMSTPSSSNNIDPSVLSSTDSSATNDAQTNYNIVYLPHFIRDDKRVKFIITPKIEYIPQEIHVGTTILSSTNASNPMTVYSVILEGFQANAYVQYVNNYHNQHVEFDENQQSETTIYIQDAYIPPANEWLKHGIIKDSNNNFYGRFLHFDNVRQYSAIGYEMARLCFELCHANEKCIIYHNKLNSFGINQYALILLYNGFVQYGNMPTDKSICKTCRQPYSDHTKNLEYRVNHKVCNNFKPLVYAVLSGALHQFERDNLTNNVFNNPNNLYGDYIAVMFVSDVAYSGVSFFNTNNILILSRIPNISKWKQIYSRIIRTRSHQGLPLSKQYAKIFTFVIEYPHETTKWKSATGLTVGELYYKQRLIANEDISALTADIAHHCISETLFNAPETVTMTEDAYNMCNELVRTDIKNNIALILRRMMNDRASNTWFVNNFIRRLKDPRVATSFINLRLIDINQLMTLVNETRRTILFKYNDVNAKFIKYDNHNETDDIPEITFDVAELGILKLTSSNIKLLISKLENDNSIAMIISRISRILKLCKGNFTPLINATPFWDKIYQLGDEFYDDDEENFIHNHTAHNRNKSRMTGCYYGNTIVFKNGSAKAINYRFPAINPKPSLPYTFKITCLTVSENSPFYIHVNIVKVIKNDSTDRRKINKGIICTSANLKEIFTYFPKIKTDLPKKQYCKELLLEICDLQDKNPNYKFVFSPFEK